MDTWAQVLYVAGATRTHDPVSAYLERDAELAVCTASRGEAAIERLEDGAFDCIVSRNELTDTTGIEVLRRVRATDPELPFILFPANGDEGLASQAVAADATEYVRDERGYRSLERISNRVKAVVQERKHERSTAVDDEWHRRLTDAGEDVIVVLDDAGEFSYLSAASERVLGYEPETLIGESGFEYVHPDDQEQTWVLFQEMVEDETFRPCAELRFAHADGSWIWLEVVGENLGPDPVLDGHLIHARDITERKRREGRLRRGQRRFEAIFDDPNLLVGLLGTDGTVLDVNDTALDYIDAEMADVRGTKLWESPWFDHDPDVCTIMRTCAERAADGEYLENEIPIRTAGGELRTIKGTFRPITDEAGGIQSLLLTGQDITEHKAIQRDRDRRYRAIFDHTYQFTGLMDPDGILLEANRTALDFGDLDPADVIGKPLWETYWWQTDEITQRELQRAIDRAATGEFVRYNVEVQGTDDTAVIDFSIRPITDEAGDVEFLIPEGRNITDLKALRERERELERRNERLDEFASIVSHDLRNPLNVARGRLALAREDVDNEHLAAVAGAHERMDSLVEELLTLARDGERVNELEPVAMSEIVDACWTTVETTDTTLTVDGETTVLADPGRLQQLFENLFQNAHRHGGDEVTVGPLENGFYVEDNGAGIPESARAQVFENGYSTCSNGAGVGLTIVEEIVAAHGWDIRLTDGTANGARFEITGVDHAD